MHPIKRSLIYVIACASLLPVSLAAQTTTPTFTSVSAADWYGVVASNSIAAGFGNGFSMATTVANTLPLPTTLGGASESLTDSTGATLSAPLFMVNAGQINYLVPAGLAPGKATVKVTDGSNSYTGALEISNVAPAIFTADSSGTGPPAAQVVRFSGGVTSMDPAPFVIGPNGSPAVTAPIKLTPYTDSVYLILYGTGIRNHSANPVIATINGIKVPVLYAGPQADVGLDQINLGPLPQTLAAAGNVNVVITVDGVPTNTTTVNIQ